MPTVRDCIVGVLLLATLYVFSVLALFIGTIWQSGNAA